MLPYRKILTIIRIADLTEGFCLETAVITVLPGLFAVTFPFPDTEAIFGFLDFQVTFAEAFAGCTFSTQRFFDSPTYKRISLRLRISFLGVLFDLAATGKVRTARKKHSVQSKSVSFFVFIGFSFMAWTEF